MFWVIAGGLVLLLALGAYLAATFTVRHMLEDGAIRRILSRKTAEFLKAEAGYLPLSNSGWSVRSGGLLAQGKPPGILTSLVVKNIKASCSLARLMERKWTVKKLEVDHAQAAFGVAAGRLVTNDLPEPPALEPPVASTSLLKVDILETRIRKTDLFWGQEEKSVGGFKNVEIKCHLENSDLQIFGSGGTFRQTAWPEFKVKNLQLHYAQPRLEVRAADFTLGQGELHAMGQLTFGEGGGIALKMQARNSPIAPYLSGGWNGKVEGAFDGDAMFDKQFGREGSKQATGSVRSSGPVLRDWPLLEKIAVVTHRPEFQRLKVSLFRAEFKWTGDRLEVSKLHAEAKGLVCIEGKFEIEDQTIQGTFDVGAAGDVLEAVPGAREKVFTANHDGYFWTTLHLSGPLKHPHEDLNERVVDAAQEHFAKGLLAPILKPGAALLELLRDLY